MDLRSKFGLDIGSRNFLGSLLSASGRLPLGAIGAASLQ
jgi:hypothetical protein